MKRLLVLAGTCLLLFGCAIPRQPTASSHLRTTAGNSGTDNILVDPGSMLAVHNAWRAKVGVKPLHWSDQLAKVAAAYAERLASRGCVMEHSHDKYGENLFWASPLRRSDGRVERQRITEAQVVEAWGSEQKLYDIRRNVCSGVCGHYTQIVWNGSREVGCAARACADASQIWICNYDPPGNIVGHKPY